MTAPTTPRVTWRAADDRVAHASLPKGRRTLCGQRIVLERLAWPRIRRCMTCVALAEGLGWSA